MYVFKHPRAAPPPHRPSSSPEQGVIATGVFWASIYCGPMVVIAFDDLGLPDHTHFPEIRTRRRQRRQRCGGRELSVTPNWRDP